MDKKQKQIIKISVFITSIFVIFLSVTYAFINVQLTGTKKQVITAGTLDLELQEDNNNLTIADAMPMYDEVGMLQNPFTFRLINNAEVETNYVLKLTNITVGEQLDTNIVKYSFTKNGVGEPALLSTLPEDGTIDSGTIGNKETIDYTLRLWIDSSVTDNTLISGKSLSYRVDVESAQISEIDITFDTQGAGTVSNATYTIGEPFGTLPTITRDGYTFGGWYTSEEVLITEDTIVDYLSDNTLYAKWIVNPAGQYILNNPAKGLNTTLEAGLYRFQGTTADNYICFGTSDKDTCTGNKDAHMYRIIGITEDGRIKVIKKEALSSRMQWYGNYKTNIAWPSSNIYNSISGSTFLTNKTYVPTGWEDLIATTDWKYGDNSTTNTTAAALYSKENSWTSTISSKIGLMYAHDYYYAYKSGGLNCSTAGSYTTCKTAWIYLTNCDSAAPDDDEWTMSRYGIMDNGRYYVNIIKSTGEVTYADLSPSNAFSTRPVFYLTNEVKYLSGTGTSTDPFIIS